MGLDVRRRLSVVNISGQSVRWRRYLPCFVFALTIAFLQLYALTGNPYFIKNTIKTLTNLRQGKNNSDGPLHILLISYARTGSSFVGDILQTLPNSFYHFEPLHFLSNSVLNNSIDEARDLLNKVFTCNVSAIEGFLQWQKRHPSYMKLKRSTKYWKMCSKSHSCYNGTYIDSYCHHRKIISAKTIRMKLKDAADLFITYPDLNLKIIYLSRDPRGALNSRRKTPIASWCKRDPICSDHNLYCSILSDDLQTVCSLCKERPDDFMVLRYEDLSLNPLAAANHLSKFLGFDSIPSEMEFYLQTHTAVNGNLREKAKKSGLDVPYLTFRNSSITAMSWRQELSFEQLIDIQEKCRTFLKGFGYYSYSTIGSLRSNINFDVNLDDAVDSFCLL